VSADLKQKCEKMASALATKENRIAALKDELQQAKQIIDKQVRDQEHCSRDTIKYERLLRGINFNLKLNNLI